MDKFEDIFETSNIPATEQEIVEETTTVEVESTEEQVEETTTAAEQDEDSATTETQEPAKTQDDERKGWIPVDAMLDERSKRQALEKELADLRAQQEAAQRAPKAPTHIPDPIDDFDGFKTAMQAEVEAKAAAKAQEQFFNYRLQDSWERATEKHGADAVETAKSWAVSHAQNNPQFEAEFYNQRDPIGWVVQQHNRQTMLSEFEKDPQGYALKLVQEQGLLPAQAASVAEAQKQEASKRPKSLAAVSSASKRPPSKTDGFDDIFA